MTKEDGNMEAVTPKDFFEITLPKRFNPTKAAGVDVIVQVYITGANGGNWIVTIKDQKLGVKEGTHPSPSLSLKMAEKDYLDLVNHKLSAEKAFFTGKVHFKGDIGLALKLREAGFL
jgi:putative sterol carrier protein